MTRKPSRASRRHHLLQGVALLTLAACGGRRPPPRTAQKHTGEFSLKDAQPTIPSLLVAKPINRPLYLVLDAGRVKNSWVLETALKRATLNDFHLFVERDLQGALSPYFSAVHVVRSLEEMPPTPHVVGDVKVDRLQFHDLQVGALLYTTIEMTWSFALRPNEADDYLFSFAGTASSTEAYPTFAVGCAQLVEAAITGMLKKLVEGKTIETLRELPAPSTSPPPPATPKPKGGQARAIFGRGAG